MSTRLARIGSAACLGLGIGSLFATRWLVALRPVVESPKPVAASGPALPAAPSMLSVVLVAVSLCLLWRTLRPSLRAFLTGLLSAASAGAVIALLMVVVPDGGQAGDLLAPRVAMLALMAAAVAVFVRGNRFAAVAPLALLGYLLPSDPVRVFAGDQLAAHAARYARLPLWHHSVDLLTSCAFVGGVIGLVTALLLSSRSPRSMILGVAGGLGLGAYVLAIHSTCTFVGMASGQSAPAIWLSTTAVSTVLLVTVDIARRAWEFPGGTPVAKLAPAFPLVLLCAAALVSARGAGAFFHLRGFHADTAYAYVHFAAGNAHFRTLDNSGRATALRRMEMFIQEYPWSAYRPAALLAKAECEFDLWRFHDAAMTLDRVVREYPHVAAYPYLLRALAHSAAGKPQVLVAVADPRGLVSQWRYSAGGLLAAGAAERCQLPLRAAGYYSGYVDYLLGEQRTSRASHSIAYASERQENTLAALKAGIPARRAETVSIKVVLGDNPVEGARVVVVRPHDDAAFPADSRCFTGAWSIAAWNGIAAVSDSSGVAILQHVPYGDYDLVLGLNRRTTPPNVVVPSPPMPIHIGNAHVSLKPIRLVPTVELTCPVRGGTLAAESELQWRSYPGAATYSVSLVRIGGPTLRMASGRVKLPGKTCWTRSALGVPRTSIDPRYFVNGYTGLQKGGVYICVVYAYGRRGEVLSTSEHYFELSEPWFRVL